VLLRATAGGDNQFKGWLIYAVAPLFLVTAAFWSTRLNDVRSFWHRV
jgi:Na+/melibiose symporter-like transporter